MVWALLLVTGFGLLFFGLGTPFADAMADASGARAASAPTSTSAAPRCSPSASAMCCPAASPPARSIVIEAGTGLGFVALVIGYVPVLYGAFSHREISVALLDARAGSPPTSTELLRRHAFDGGQEALVVLLAEWERWSAEILESHISYPILCYYRSQHDNQSWLSALTAVLDTCALLISVVPGQASRQAQLTFAMARHALVDLGHVFHLEKEAKAWRASGGPNRLVLRELRSRLRHADRNPACASAATPSSPPGLHALRALYEPHAAGARRLSRHDAPRMDPRTPRQGPVEDRRGRAVAGGRVAQRFRGERPRHCGALARGRPLDPVSTNEHCVNYNCGGISGPAGAVGSASRLRSPPATPFASLSFSFA